MIAPIVEHGRRISAALPTDCTASGDELTTGYARTPDKRRICEACANIEELAAFATADHYAAYLSGDGKHVTTWTGEPLARVTYEGVARTGFYGSEITYIRAVSPDGREWYGKNGGRGMFVNVRRAKGVTL